MLRGNSGTSALRRAGRLEDAGRPNASFLFSEKRESEHKWLVLIKRLLDFYILRRSEFHQGIIRGMKRYDFPAKKNRRMYANAVRLCFIAYLHLRHELSNNKRF